LGRHVIVVEAFDRGDVGAFTGGSKGDAGTGRNAVEQHRTGAANAVLAAEMRTRKVELVTHEVGKAGARIGQDLDRTLINVERDHVHAAASFTARFSTLT